MADGFPEFFRYYGITRYESPAEFRARFLIQLANAMGG